MRVLHVLDTINPSGAGPVEAARLYCAIARADYRPEVLSLDSDIEAWRHSWRVPVHAVGRSRLLPRYSSGLIPWLRANGHRFDAVVVHSVFGYHLVGVWRALPPSTPYFLILHGSLNRWFRKAYPRKHRKKVAFWRTIIGRAVAGARSVFYLCQEEKRIADPAFPIRSVGEAFVPLGILPHQASAKPFFERFPSLRGKRLLLFFGRICYTKGCDLLLEAFAKAASHAPEAHLVMCGTDHEQWQSALMSRAGRLGIANRVTWIGPLFGDERWPLLSAAELLILPSRCEAFPIVVLEALSCGTPVLISRDVNIHPQIENSGAGLVCDGTVESIEVAIRHWLALNPDERGEFAERAAKCQKEQFDLQRAFEAHVRAIRGNLRMPETDALEAMSATG